MYRNEKSPPKAGQEKRNKSTQHNIGAVPIIILLFFFFVDVRPQSEIYALARSRRVYTRQRDGSGAELVTSAWAGTSSMYLITYSGEQKL
jgi:hypothetical protein